MADKAFTRKELMAMPVEKRREILKEQVDYVVKNHPEYLQELKELDGYTEINGAVLIAIERRRQIEGEGYTPDHDDEHLDGALACAGASYAAEYGAMNSELSPRARSYMMAEALALWPFMPSERKPTPDDPLSQLIKAGAFIAAEIDSLIRKTERKGGNVVKLGTETGKTPQEGEAKAEREQQPD